MDEALKERFSDLDLSKLLRRIDGREVTTFLCLSGCTAIKGTGLEPLRNSRVLERVSLINTSVDENPSIVLWIIRSMFAFKLFVVHLSIDVKENPSVVDFMRNLRHLRHLEARENPSPCRSCQQPVTEDSRQIVPRMYGFPLMRCFYCREHFCRRGSCPMESRECSICASSCCKERDAAGQCHYCGYTYCYDCFDMFECDDCGKQSCRDCGGVFECPNCSQTVCKKCRNTPDVCMNGCFLCRHCRELGSCSGCNRKFLRELCGGLPALQRVWKDLLRQACLSRNRR